MAVQIDPKTGERIDAQTPQIDPKTGERVANAAPEPQGFFSSAADSSGLSGLAHAIAHPIDTITGIPGAIASGAKNALNEAHDEVNALRTNGLTQETRRKLGGDIPIIGPTLAKAQSQHDAGNDAGMAGTLAGTVAGFAAPQAFKAIPGIAIDAASAARTAAIGDTDAAALRGLQVGPKSPKALSTLNSVEGARPYLQGAKNLEDLQSKIQPAKDEIFSEYNKAVQGIGNRKVVGPDGPTTVADLESQRLQLSALNRGLKANNPEAIQLAQQKGLTQADLLAKENAVKAALDPELASTGIDPQAIRKTFGNVAQIGSRISGKSTLIEPPQPSGLGKIGNISIKQPFQAPGQVLSGLRDIVAGRPILSAKPTDLGISEGFRSAGPKPQLGKFMMPTPPTTAGLLERGSIQMPSPAEGEYISSTPPPYIDATTRAQRLGLLLPDKTGGPIELPYVPEMSAGEKLAAQMQLLRKSPQFALPSKANAIPLPPLQ